MVDLCAAPGGWSEVCSAAPQSPLVVAVDLAPMSPLPHVQCVQGDLTHPDTVRAIVDLLRPLRSGGADVVLCDAAPDVLNQTDVDEMLQHQLVRAAISVARRVMREDGSFVCKVFRGPQLPALLRSAQSAFQQVELAKPTASRNGSVEAFIVARHLQPTAETDECTSGATSSDSEVEVCDEAAQQCVAVSFVSCGDDMALDSDQTYSLSFRIPSARYTAYQPLAPVAAPIDPPYEQSIVRLRDKVNSSRASYNT